MLATFGRDFGNSRDRDLWSRASATPGNLSAFGWRLLLALIMRLDTSKPPTTYQAISANIYVYITIGAPFNDQVVFRVSRPNDSRVEASSSSRLLVIGCQYRAWSFPAPRTQSYLVCTYHHRRLSMFLAVLREQILTFPTVFVPFPRQSSVWLVLSFPLSPCRLWTCQGRNHLSVSRCLHCVSDSTWGFRLLGIDISSRQLPCCEETSASYTIRISWWITRSQVPRGHKYRQDTCINVSRGLR